LFCFGRSGALGLAVDLFHPLTQAGNLLLQRFASDAIEVN
jgi:hypothetical protein